MSYKAELVTLFLAHVGVAYDKELSLKSLVLSTNKQGPFLVQHLNAIALEY